jgi:hypothetical protein
MRPLTPDDLQPGPGTEPVGNPPAAAAAGPKSARGGSTATRLVGMALERYQLGLSNDGQPYAVRPGHHVVRMLRGGKSLRAELSQAYYREHGKAAPQQALADALLALEGMAEQRDPDQAHLRVAAADGAVWLDLGDAAETAVKIDPGGWRVVSDGVPVLFRRTALTGAMPVPAAGGDLDLLWGHVNVSRLDRSVVVAWLLAAIIEPETPHPILSIFGEQGTGKSTGTKRIVEVVDPSPVPLRKPPRDPESWVTAAAGSWVVGLDNLSQVPDWLSDSLCRAVTGDGDVRRKLYSDADLAVFQFRRCIAINGIDVGALRGDLADRVAKIDLDRISEDQRAEEKYLDAKWAADHPVILAGLLSLGSEVMGRLPAVRVAARPRMADFARVLAAVDQLLGTDGLGRFSEQAQMMAEDSLASNPFLVRLHDMRIDFTGKAADLLSQATPDVERWRPPRDWPKDPRAVTSLLKRNAPALRRTGWVVEEDLDTHDKVTIWTLRHPEALAPAAPQPGGCQFCVQRLLTPQSRQRGICERCWLSQPGLSDASQQQGSDVCPDCGDPLEGPPLHSRCKDKHGQAS